MSVPDIRIYHYWNEINKKLKRMVDAKRLHLQNISMRSLCLCCVWDKELIAN